MTIVIGILAGLVAVQTVAVCWLMVGSPSFGIRGRRLLPPRASGALGPHPMGSDAPSPVPSVSVQERLRDMAMRDATKTDLTEPTTDPPGVVLTRNLGPGDDE